MCLIQAMTALDAHLNLVEREKRELQSLFRRLCEENGDLREAINSTQQQLHRSEQVNHGRGLWRAQSSEIADSRAVASRERATRVRQFAIEIRAGINAMVFRGAFDAVDSVQDASRDDSGTASMTSDASSTNTTRISPRSPGKTVFNHRNN
jgi:hypothetical protein